MSSTGKSEPRALLQHAFEQLSKYPENPPTGYVFVPKGDVYITRQCRKLTSMSKRKLWIVYDPKTNEKLGIHCFQHIVEAVREDAAATEGKRQRAVAAKDSRDHEQAHAMLLTFFPSIPDDACKEILEHGFQKGSGRVGRSKTIEDRLKVQLAVNAHIRHRLTPYDSILAANRGQYDKLAARDMVYSQVEEIADSWRATSFQPQISQIPRRQTTGSHGSAATLDANRRRRVRRSKEQLASPDEAQSLREAFGGLRLMENQIETVARAEAARRLAQKVARKVAHKDRLQSTTRDVGQPKLDLSVKSTKEGKRRAGKGKRSQEGQERGDSIPPNPAKREEYRRLMITAHGVELVPRRIDTDVPEFELSHDEPRTPRLLRSRYRTAASTPEGGRHLSNMPGNGVLLEAKGRDTYVPTFGSRPNIEAPRQSRYPLRSSHRTTSGVHAKNDASEGTIEVPSANSRTVVEESEWMDIDEISMRTAEMHLAASMGAK